MTKIQSRGCGILSGVTVLNSLGEKCSVGFQTGALKSTVLRNLRSARENEISRSWERNRGVAGMWLLREI